MLKAKALFLLLTSAIVASALTGCTSKQGEAPAAQKDQAQSAQPARPAPNPLKNAYFGDLHLHTGL